MSSEGTRSLLIRVIAILLPLALLAVIEGLMRLFGYGYNHAIFVTDKDYPTCWVLNPDVSKRYFSNLANATIGNHEPFKKIKDKNSYRVFVLGESTTIGYPYLTNGSFHRWLQYRLQMTFPEKEVEIINLALTAVNSYTVRDFADELAPYQPDAVIIYMGHNEYYGALGVSSTSFLGKKPALVHAAIKIRQLKIAQWFNSIVYRARPTPNTENRTLMQRMSDKSQVPYGSDLFYAGLTQFETNLRATLESLEKDNIPVFIATVVSNEKDLKPFISRDDAPEGSASNYFTAAQLAYAKGDFDVAKKHFVKARDLDRLRFRAPDSLNSIIRNSSANYPHTTVVEVAKKFEKESPHRILGNELLLEHVHPNLTGYALMADAFYLALRQSKQIDADWKGFIPFDSLLRVMPVTNIDSLHGVYEILMLREQWPFYEKMPSDTATVKSMEEKLAGALAVKQITWGKAMLTALHEYERTHQTDKALKISEAIALDNPQNFKAFNQAANAAMQTSQTPKAVYYWQKSFKIKPDFEVAKSIFVELLKLNKPEQALIYIAYAERNNKGSFSFKDLHQKVSEIASLKKRLTGNAQDGSLLNQMAMRYLQFANTEGAWRCVTQALRVDPANKMAAQLQEQIQQLKSEHASHFNSQ